MDPHSRRGILYSEGMRNWVISITLLAALPAWGNTSFRVARMTRNDVPPGKGQCDIRLQVDNEVEVAVRRDFVSVRTLAGQDARNDGSECNYPLPDRDIRSFTFQVTDSRNEIRLVEQPNRRNDFTALVHIRDSSGGFGRYVFRLAWAMVPGGNDVSQDNRPDNRPDIRPDNRPDFGRPPVPERFAWNNVIAFSGTGSGESRLNDYGQRLRDVRVNIDRGGKIVVAFRGERGRDVVFNGTLMGRQGQRLQADVLTEDRRLRGTMELSVDDAQRVNSITYEATDGRDRLHLTWDRR